MSGVETRIEGSPGGIEGAATWLRQSLAPQLDGAGEAFNGARRDADASWLSTAGDEFSGTMKRARDRVDDLESACRAMADDLDDFAGDLRRCQEDMRAVRTTARDAGLTVAGTVVQDPGPGPARPPDDFTGTDAEVAAHNERVAAYDDHQDLITAYNAASTEAARVDRAYAAACNSLNDEYLPGQHAAWIVTLGDILGDSAAGVLAGLGIHHSSRLQLRAQDLLEEASRLIDDLQANPDRYLKRKWFIFQTLDEARLEADRLAIEGRLNEAQQLLDDAEAARGGPTGRGARVVRGLGRILGPVGLGLGIYNDYQEGETTEQIIVSQGASFAIGAGVGAGAGALATIGTGAAMGAAFGSVVPGVGTAVGAVVGTVVGAGVAIFADGAIDSLFENGPDVGEAWDSGVEALQDTGEAIGDFASDVGSTVGGWFS